MNTDAHKPTMNKVNLQGTLQTGDILFADLSGADYPCEFVITVDKIGQQEYRDGEGAIKTRLLNLKIKRFEAV